MNKSDFTRSRVGDRVYSPFGPECSIGGTNGVIRKVYPEGISTNFNDDSVYFFTLEGIYHRAIDSFPTLFHCRPKVEIPPPPKRKVKKWIAFHEDSDGKIYIAGSDMYPLLCATEIEAKQKHNAKKINPVEVEVYDD